jgi:hypothetical protein
MELQVILGLFCDFLAGPGIPNLFGSSDFAKQRLIFFEKLLKFGHVLDFRLTVSKNVIRSILKCFTLESAGASSLGEHTTWRGVIKDHFWESGPFVGSFKFIS